MSERRLIFVLGDSRTGTTSLHRWFIDRGLRALHYFVAEAGLQDPLHRHRAANWPLLARFIRKGDIAAYSDYPVRVFFRELAAAFPDASFILTTRRDTATWRASMQRFFAGQDLDIDLLQAFYLAWNEEIRAMFAESRGHFLDLCIDDDAVANGTRLAAFLGLPASGLPHLNASFAAG